jgi:hypothetical protein
MTKLNINDFLYHPCSIDIMKHKVMGIKTYEDFIHYHLKAVHNI